MNYEKELTQNMKDELKRNNLVASMNDYETRKNHLIDINDGFHNVLDFIPDFIMIDLLKEYELECFSAYQNIDEFAEGILGYKHGNVQLMRKLARHFYIFNPQTKEFELDYDFMDYSSSQLEKMSAWSKQELLEADINPSMTVYEIDARVRENGKNSSVRVTDEEIKVIEKYRFVDDEIKNKIKSLLNLQ
ncbi:hypothetical protein [Butyrivibrio hungatei]|uniref:Uncharacterized protein n=1 Tax=Butyrivibrio hungatei TaxID=185008 RepID=A0A1D9P0Y4_9FIRM|nr:hypothetical protein [Butyrivibrio hungatei]AOZ96220.1 hypothetical protein bhn_I1186 [Butyrivibrio hungatei]